MGRKSGGYCDCIVTGVEAVLLPSEGRVVRVQTRALRGHGLQCEGRGAPPSSVPG